MSDKTPIELAYEQKRLKLLNVLTEALFESGLTDQEEHLARETILFSCKGHIVRLMRVSCTNTYFQFSFCKHTVQLLDDHHAYHMLIKKYEEHDLKPRLDDLTEQCELMGIYDTDMNGDEAR